MPKNSSKTSIFLASCMLSIILLSLISSVILYRQIASLQVAPVRTELVSFINEYEYELMRSTMAFTEAYNHHNDSGEYKEFNTWFNMLLSRYQGLERIEKQHSEIFNRLNLRLLKTNLQQIKLFISRPDILLPANLEMVKQLFNQLVIETHQFQKQWVFQNEGLILAKQNKTLSSYQNSVVLIFVTFVIGIIMVLYLFSNNKKLLILRRTLEQRVYMRTKELKDSNSHLISEVQERKKTELQLMQSQFAAEQAHKKIQYQANFDPLTKLANRNLFLERFAQASIRADRNNTFVALLFLDLDRFKYINDTLGHSIGDKLLQEASSRIQEVLRASDTAARFGGDEFAVILSDIEELHTVNLIVDRILKSMASPFRLCGNDAFVSASIGITVYPTDGKDSETLLRKADSAMYKAKDEGRNNFQFFTAQMDIEANERRLLEAALYKAVEAQEFSLHYQPIIKSDNNGIAGVEALIRWKDEIRGYIPPEEFIPLAEEIGLILPIGEWVLKEACSTAVKWVENISEPFILSVNISSRQFQKCNMAEQIANVLAQTGFAAKHLMLEITEGLLMGDDQQILNQLQEIREMGVSLAIDDFGTGYSSLSYLKKYPITTLKIDRSFIQDINIDTDDDELIKGILSMAKSLNVSVVAEGVETLQQAEFLLENNCLLIQGFHFSKPMPAIEFSQYLQLSDSQPSLELKFKHDRNCA
ncbi:MAG: PAS/PAC sensor-containing diguanylate cyclase/phosphodiesterase [Osedax symbiont Rs2]|nr:MAG: PAS/PAC sensor-containing diguanylate cyclase/phosphodiesterase [Osedax symbiont Rs2]